MKRFIAYWCLAFLLSTFTEARNRKYYLAINEIIWDYAPSGLNLITNNKLDDEPNSRIFTDSYIGKRYKKAVYRRYADETFTTLVSHDPNLGFMGPTLRAEVGDTITVHLYNNASRPYSLHPHGVFYTKANEGARYKDNSDLSDKVDDAVPSGGQHTYEWEVLPQYGPSSDDPNCMTWAYHSHLNSPKDINTGLIGALLVCRKGTYDQDDIRKDVDHEFVALFFVCDEADSWYYEENLRSISDCEEVEDEEDFERSNKMNVVNAYVYANTPGYDVCQGDTISWHVMAMGSNRDLHPIQFQGQTARREHHRQDSLILIPATFSTLQMRANNPGRWYVACKSYSHFTDGMVAWLTIDPACRDQDAPLPSASLSGRNREYFIAIEEELWNFAPSGLNMLENKSLVEPGSNSEVFYASGPNRIGGVYKKAFFRGYTDRSFTILSPRQSDFGFLGPLVAGEIGDTIKIHLKNTARNHAFNIEPHGVFFRDSFAVPPLSERMFTWTLPEDVSPLSSDPNCLTYIYTSTVSYTADTNSGLVGPLLVCKNGTLEEEIAKEHRFLFMTVFDENESWYFEENVNKFTNETEIDAEDGDFEESNLMHSINGLMFGNLEVNFCADKVTSLHVMSVGSDVDIHGIDLEGINIRIDGVNTGVADVFAHTFQTVNIQPSFVGKGRMFCRTIDHTVTGMSAIYNSVICNSHVNNTTDQSEAEQFDGVPYYIAAEEVVWDYNPTGVNLNGESVNTEGVDGYLYAHHQPGRFIGSRYKKVLYQEYTDSTFTVKKQKSSDLGLLGPVIQGEVGKTISVVFFNKANRPYNMFPWGAVDPAANSLEGQAVPPGGKKQYHWMIPESASPAADQPACQSFVYLSNVDPAIDPIDGLIGPLLVCKNGTFPHGVPPTEPILTDKEFFLLFLIFDENLSHYYEENLRVFLQVDPETFDATEDFEESNKKKAINGRLWHVDGLQMFVGDHVRWHLIGWGNEEDYHSVHFHAHTYVHVSEGSHRGDVFSLYPGFLGTVEMRMIAVGDWLLHCHVFDHMNGGMETLYSVVDSSSLQTHSILETITRSILTTIQQVIRDTQELSDGGVNAMNASLPNSN